ncbi:unnamed protein product [Brassicogethes aeneus]|uniref:BED-type domain-containing protein n=1 Tax=Brassicogethes aeneus TaxID=1431903 RepID=A0A9P0BCL1_BRAAE|nr:unnamed protein product [Brassicogethes aeneus]
MGSRSKIWSYFKKNDDRVQCNMCDYNVLFNGSTTSNLWTHIRSKHVSILNSSNVDEEIFETNQNQASSSTTLSTTTQPKITDIFSTEKNNQLKQEKITQIITRMICQDELPISFVENGGFKQLLSYLAPWYKIPVKKTIKLRIDALYDIEKKKIMKDMSTIDDIALTTDCWSSRATESYITFTAHYITPEWKHFASNITTEHMEERHTIANLQDKIDKILIEWKIKPKSRAIVHDNAANKVGAAKNFPYSISCFAHSLQLALNKILLEPYSKDIIN